MQRVDLVVDTPIDWSVRTRQVASMFDLKHGCAKEAWRFDVEFPEDWSIGLIVGPSGSGKSTVANELFGDCFVDPKWPNDGTVIDGFDAAMPIKEVCGHLSRVGFSSPPSWMKPYRVLSNGQKFRADLARTVAAKKPIVAMDEFTSVVDRTVAQIGSAAVSKAIRRSGKRFVAVGCHYDVIEWLQPDWVLHMPSGQLDRRSVQRWPEIALKVQRVHRSAWNLFRRDHYLDHSINPSAQCFIATMAGRPVAFASVLSLPHAVRPQWRGHRTVCLPDFQGVGIGNRLSGLIASAFAATGKPYSSVTSHPAMIGYRAASTLWKMRRKPSRNVSRAPKNGLKYSSAVATWSSSLTRLTASFEYVGPVNSEAAKAFGLKMYRR